MQLYRKALGAAVGGFGVAYLTMLVTALTSDPAGAITVEMFTAPLRVSIAAGIAAGLGAWMPANKIGGKNVIDLAKGRK